MTGCIPWGIIEHKEDKMNHSNHSYKFVAADYDVDYIRIVREAPKNTPFILVETRTRSKQAKEYVILVHKDVLTDPRTQGLVLGYASYVDKHIGPNWGHGENPNEDDSVLYSYRWIAGDGPAPGFMKQQIERIKRELNEKDTLVLVNYL